LKTLDNQLRNEPSFCHWVGHHLAFTKCDTAGEVVQALIRSIGIGKIS
jgi:hypothetical protein